MRGSGVQITSAAPEFEESSVTELSFLTTHPPPLALYSVKLEHRSRDLSAGEETDWLLPLTDTHPSALAVITTLFYESLFVL
jgi:hypothetical protein